MLLNLLMEIFTPLITKVFLHVYLYLLRKICVLDIIGGAGIILSGKQINLFHTIV